MGVITIKDVLTMVASALAIFKTIIELCSIPQIKKPSRSRKKSPN